MSTIKTQITSVITLELTDGEAGALSAICGYGPDLFIKWFEQTHGKHYIAPYKQHLKSLFDKARILQHHVKKVEDLRSKFPKEIQL